MGLGGGEEAAPAVRRARDATGGPTAVTRARWRDPDDTTPGGARAAREVAGWRTFCPLERMRKLGHGGIEEMHIHAAHKLREAYDHYRLGFSAPRDELLPVTAATYGPKGGPSRAAMASAKAGREFVRAMLLFREPDQRLIGAIVLGRQTVNAWCHAEGRRLNRAPVNQMLVHGALLVILNVLVLRFQTDIEHEIAAGRRLAAA